MADRIREEVVFGYFERGEVYIVRGVEIAPMRMNDAD